MDEYSSIKKVKISSKFQYRAKLKFNFKFSYTFLEIATKNFFLRDISNFWGRIRAKFFERLEG